mmetsp:Transcript_20176/g.20278  ORF Transcript_20176/g.20278 Transcript_20176/m.20278 type:complete len:241 (-) Transcript_20176:79-801(-)
MTLVIVLLQWLFSFVFAKKLNIQPKVSQSSVSSNVFPSYNERSKKFNKPIIITLVGIPGSGKSTLAKRLLSSLNKKSSEFSDESTITNNLPIWKSFNQDALGTRKRVYNLSKAHLEINGSVIIDRCNFNKIQRKHWVELASLYNSTSLCVVLPHCSDVYICSQRATQRGDDGIHSPITDWRQVCETMYSSFVYPTVAEGYTTIIDLANQRERSLRGEPIDISPILQCVRSVQERENVSEK